MAEYIEFPLETDPDALLAAFVEEIRTYFPNYDPNPGSLSYRVAAALCRMIAEGRDVAALVPGEIFRTAGSSLFDVDPNEATAARADTEWTMRDDAGYGPIPAGTVVSVDGVLFETTEEVSVPSGETVANPVGIIAIDEGEAASGLGAPGATVDVEEAFEYVNSVTLNGATMGGSDGEPQDEYMDRLRTTLQLLSPVPILPRDLAELAKTVPGVERAVVIDNYKADTQEFNQPGHATVAVADAAGAQVPQPTKDEVDALLTGPEDRLLNAVIWIIDPTWSDIDVDFAALAFPGSDPDAVEAAAIDAVRLFLDPNNWGQPNSGELREWHNKSVVSRFDLAGALDRVEGLDRATAITIEGAAADFNLTGVAPLPRPGVITGAVTLP